MKPVTMPVPYYARECAEILAEVTNVMNVLERAEQPDKLYGKIDLFFYVEKSAKIKSLIRDLSVPDPELIKVNALREHYALFKSRWKNDYIYIATPTTLHAYL